VISDAHEGIKAAVTKVLHACWQRCRVHFMRNALVSPTPARAVVASYPPFIATAFAQDDAEAAKAQWRRVADQLRPKLPPASAAVCRKYPRSFVVLAISRSPGGAMKVNGENKKPGPLRRSGIS
jgi:transposase-like protein